MGIYIFEILIMIINLKKEKNIKQIYYVYLVIDVLLIFVVGALVMAYFGEE